MRQHSGMAEHVVGAPMMFGTAAISGGVGIGGRKSNGHQAASADFSTGRKSVTGRPVAWANANARGKDVVPSRSIRDSCPGVTPTESANASSVSLRSVRYLRSGVSMPKLVWDAMLHDKQVCIGRRSDA